MFNRFDVCEAYYLFARHYHIGGDTSDGIFERLERVRFRPSLALKKHDNPFLALSEEGRLIYDMLCREHPDAKEVVTHGV